MFKEDVAYHIISIFVSKFHSFMYLMQRGFAFKSTAMKNISNFSEVAMHFMNFSEVVKSVHKIFVFRRSRTRASGRNPLLCTYSMARWCFCYSMNVLGDSILVRDLEETGIVDLESKLRLLSACVLCANEVIKLTSILVSVWLGLYSLKCEVYKNSLIE